MDYTTIVALIVGAAGWHVGLTRVWPAIQKKRLHKARGRKAAATKRTRKTTPPAQDVQ